MKYSVTIASLVVIIAGFLGLGDIFPQEEVESFVNIILQAVGIIGVWYGRYRQGDISALGMKK